MRLVRISLALPMLGVVIFAQTQAPPAQIGPNLAAPTFVVDARQLPKKLHIIAFGDIRFTDPGNSDASNASVRDLIVKKIADEKPDALLISGDIPYSGSKDSDWRFYDQETAPWRNAGLRIYPALGNHEYVGDHDHALRDWWQRFPDMKEKRWYSVQFANCYFIALDSNSDLASGSAQRKWLETQLNNIPKTTDFVFLVLHHPSYPASSDHVFGGGHAARQQEQRLAALLEGLQPKLTARLIEVAGHVHNYERYEHAGVTYIVSGGGGAKPYLFQRSPQDKYQGTGITYHYVDFSIEPGKLSAKMMKWEDPQWKERDSFKLTTTNAVVPLPVK